MAHIYVPLNIVQFYGVEPSIWTDPKLFRCPNGQQISVNLYQPPIGLSKMTVVGPWSGSSESTVLNRNFGPSNIPIVDCNGALSKHKGVDHNFGPSKITIVDCNSGPFKFAIVDRSF